MKKLLILGITMLMLCGSAIAQDFHFSQFYAAPLSLNPALTGKFKGQYRLSIIYRNQWSGLVNVKPFFSTPAISGELSMFQNKWKKDAIGIGLSLVNDQANEGAFNTIYGYFSVAYHKGFGKSGRTQLSIGAQGGYIYRNIDFTNTLFASNYDPITLEPILPSNEVLEGTTAHEDVNAGLMFSTGFGDNFRMYLGGAYMHLTQPDETVYVGGSSPLPSRIVGHGGFEIDLGERIMLIPGGLYQRQANATEINYGVTLGYHVVAGANPKDNATLFVGIWNRWDESLIGKLGLEFNSMRIGASYDVGISQHKKDSKNASIGSTTPTAYEVSFVYIGTIFKPKDDRYLFNPRY